MSKTVLLLTAVSTVLCIGPDASANAVDDLLPGHWLELADTRLDAHDPEDDPALNPDWPGWAPWHGIEGLRAIMDDWSTATYDSQRKRIAVWGGGHAGYAGNDVYVFDIETLEWTRITNPSVDVSITGNTLYTDGLPRARETYNYLEYVPYLDLMVSFGGANLFPGAHVTSESAAFNFDTLTWDMSIVPPHPGTSFLMYGAMAVLDESNGHIWFAQPGVNPVQEFNPVTNSWSSHSRNDTGQYRNAAIDQRNRYLIWTGRHGDLYAFDLDDPSRSAIPRVTTGDTEIELIDYPGLAWHAPSERIIGWGQGPSVYALDTDTWVWTRIDPDPANTVIPTLPNSNGTHGRWRYIPEKDAFFLVNRVSENVYFYKLPDDSVDTDGDGAADDGDNCRLAVNGPDLPDDGGNTQLDTDGDGIGNACDADIAMPNDCIVNFLDLNVMKAAFFSSAGDPEFNADADGNGDGSINFADLNGMKTQFFRDYTLDNPSGIANDCLVDTT